MAGTTVFHLLALLLLSTATTTIAATASGDHHRRLLHQPFFVITTSPSLAPTQPPFPSPQPQPQPQPQSHPHQQPKYPFDTSPNTPQRPFFPSYPSPPPPPSPTNLATFPANISSLLFPHQHPSSSSHHRRVIIIAVSASLLSAALLFSLLICLLLLKHRHPTSTTTTVDKSSRSDSLRLFPPNVAPSDSTHHHKQPPRYTSANTSSEFLYLGTLVNSRSGIDQQNISNSGNVGIKIGVSAASQYQKLGSPELRPLPPLPRYNVFTPSYQSGEQFNPSNEVGACGDNVDDADDEQFFSPRGSSGRKESPTRVGSSSRREFQRIGGDNFGSRSFNSRTASYPYSNSCSPTSSISTNASPATNASSRSLKSKSPDSIMNFPAQKQPLNLRLVSNSSSSSSERDSGNTQNSPDRISSFSGQNKQSPVRNGSLSKQFMPKKLPPPPPPPPPPRFWETAVASRMAREPNTGGPPVLIAPSRPVVLQTSVTNLGNSEELKRDEVVEKNEETLKPKLKPLHWDKVRASSDRVMVWDQIKSSSFQLNEEMIETLFMVNNSNLTPKDNGWRPVIPSANQENRVLDPKKSQNIAILLRALNVTIDEVCEALSEGNSDTLGAELLESLLKMAPTRDEERKLKEFKDESPFKLGPAEKFLKAVLDIPFAFRRVDAMLYIVNFDSEVEYLKRSFETLEVACEELRKSRMFLKLLEAVLKTGNRMNVGTNRGDAHAFKLDTLLKLVDVKGTDGKTTLLHFVVQEIIRSEGSRLSGANQNLKDKKTEQFAFQDDVVFRKLGLQVVSGLSGELTNVKKAAAMDSDVISSEVAKLASGITKIREVVKLNEEFESRENSEKFSESMDAFLKKAQEEIVRIQAQESAALSMVKEITQYFHGNSAKEEAHPFRIFMVVRDFLSILDHVCKEVGKINERTICSSVRPMPVNATLPLVFPGLNGKQHYASSDDESSSSS